MPTARATRSAVTRAASAAALLLALTGCSLFDRDSGSDAQQADPDISATSAPTTPSASASATASVSTVRETCDRALEIAETARQQLQDDPQGLLAEVEDLAATAPPELSGEIAAVREAVEGYRQGDRSLFSVAGEARELQERCTG